MINWKLEVGDVACLVDDMKTADYFVWRGWIEGRRNEVLRYLDRAPRSRRWQGCEDHAAQDTDAGDLG
jgi:hypothetical protein